MSDVHIVTIAQNLPGPVAVAALVAEGAIAVKVEPPGGDPLAVMSPSWYAALHEGVERRTLDLKSTDGRRALHDLLAGADVFVTSHRPTALARLGLDADTLRGGLPRLRGLAIVGDTAHPDVAGHDLTYQAKAGLVADALPRTVFADLAGAAKAVAAVLLLLREPPGTWREVGIFDSVRELTAPLRHRLTTPDGAIGGAVPAYGVYPARDGFVAVAALEPHFRARLYDALGRPLDAALANAFVDRTAAEWEDWARARDIPLVAVRGASRSFRGGS